MIFKILPLVAVWSLFGCNDSTQKTGDLSSYGPAESSSYEINWNSNRFQLGFSSNNQISELESVHAYLALLSSISYTKFSSNSINGEGYGIKRIGSTPEDCNGPEGQATLPCMIFRLGNTNKFAPEAYYFHFAYDVKNSPLNDPALAWLMDIRAWGKKATFPGQISRLRRKSPWLESSSASFESNFYQQSTS